MNGLGRAALGAALATLALAEAGRALAAPNVAPATDGAAIARPPSPVRRFALVVGSNRPPRPGLVTLRYADDDAVRWSVLFRTFGAEVELLTDLDVESERLYGAEVPPHRSPTHPEVMRAMARLRGEIARAHGAGVRTAFYFIYAGHGDEEDGEGFVGLADGRLLRHELEEEILAVSGADTNHVIVDACRSYYLAYDRGPGGTRRPWPEPYFNTGTAARFRNTGFVLASSSGGPAHEWEEFQAGIFSHEVRSGLLGGADANGDGKITYAELAAFVRVANQAVRNDRYRPEILARAPSDGDDVLLDVRDAVAGHVRFGAGLAGRQVLEDELGVRWADVHPGPLQHLTLALPAEPWGGHVLFVESLATNTEYQVKAGTDVDLAGERPQPRSVLARGALHEAFALLFAIPFDVAAVTGAPEPDVTVVATGGADLRPDRPFWTRSARRTTALVTGAAGIGALAAAGGLAWKLREDADNASGAERAVMNGELGGRNAWITAAAVGGAVLTAAAAALLLWNRRTRE
ncbi:MAG TPA: caspase family protein [Polyangia bacterium]|nr:caspase family protein [Polyangia bacterium]